MSVDAILIDIEGTISSISFVRKVLFPYARNALPTFVTAHGSEPAVRRWLDAVAADSGDPNDDRTLVKTLQGWIDEDRKHTALKALQGMIWAHGYQVAAFAAPIYRDAARAMITWHSTGLPLYVYSSGSVAAQQSFFAHSDCGDLTSLIAGWFDTEVGSKRAATSYQRIAESIDSPAAKILFLSDLVPELDAARDAGLQTTLVDRREDHAEPRSGEAAHAHSRVESLAEITLQLNNRARQN